MSGQSYIEVGTSVIPAVPSQRHAYVLFHYSNGEERFVRGGPENQGEIVNNTLLGEKTFGKIKMTYGEYDSRSVDYQDPGEPKHERRVVWQGNDYDLAKKYDAALHTAKQIDASNFEYSPLFNNSNTVANVVLKSIDVTPRLPIGKDGKEVLAPAFHRDLHEDVGVGGFKSGYSFDGKHWKDGYNREVAPPAVNDNAPSYQPKGHGSGRSNFDSSMNEPELVNPLGQSPIQITKDSSIDDMFDALYVAAVTNDVAASKQVAQAYGQSNEGQAWLAMGQQLNQQEQQAAIEAQQQALAQQAALDVQVQRGPVMRVG